MPLPLSLVTRPRWVGSGYKNSSPRKGVPPSVYETLAFFLVHAYLPRSSSG